MKKIKRLATIILCMILLLGAISINGSSANVNIYNMGEETYSFKNYPDKDSMGHCFGMAVTSSAYYTGLIDKSIIGLEDTNLYAMEKTDTVKAPICQYQKIQGKYRDGAVVAGGNYNVYAGSYNVEKDWDQVVDYVKDHYYDNKGTLVLFLMKDLVGGHAINFLRYEEVNGQQRIYAYDNNHPETETYFYKNANGKVYQAPKHTFTGSIDTIGLMDVATYLELVENYNSARYFYAAKGTVSVVGAEEYLLHTGVEQDEYVMIEVPEEKTKVTIKPLVDNACFEYMNKSYSFNEIGDDTYGVFTLASIDGVTVDKGSVDFKIYDDADKLVSVFMTGFTVNYKKSGSLAPVISAGSKAKYTVSYSSSDPKTVSVDSSGSVKGLREGSATITVTVDGGHGDSVTDSCTVIVRLTFWQKLIRIFLLGWIWY